MAAEVPKLGRLFWGATEVPECTNFKRTRKGNKIVKPQAFTDTQEVSTATFGEAGATFEFNLDVLDAVHKAFDIGDSDVLKWYPQGNTSGKPICSGTVTIENIDEEYDSESYNHGLVTVTGAMTWALVP